MEDKNCKAIIQQGERKGLQCLRDKSQNGYCIYHQRNYTYEQLKLQNKKLCNMFFRGCNNELSQEDVDNKYINCKECREKKSGKGYNCNYKGCTFKIKIKDDKYCGKHIRQLIRDNEIDNIKYCDIDRGCFNKIISGTKCEECKNIEKVKVSKDIESLRQKYNITIDKNPYILDKLQEDKTISISELWRALQKNAYSRTLLFTLAENYFEQLIIKPCYYCGFVSNTRLNGIDRMNNNKGYILSNCISCCKMCNIIKNVQHPNEFLDKINIINNHVFNDIAIQKDFINKWNGYLSKASRKSYKDYKYMSENRKISFLLTEKEYDTLISGKCYLCGIENLSNHTNGIDRFDSSIRSYTIENSRSCCGHCNVMKGTLSYSEFIMKCIQIKKYNCDRTIFNSIPAYSKLKCRNEVYTSDDVYEMMNNGKYMKYIEWCIEKEKSPEFISAMNIICNSDDFNNIINKENIINNIKKEMEKERNRHTQSELLSDIKNIQCSTLYSYITQGKIEYFKDWYNSNYKKSSLFDEKFQELINILPSLNKDDGVDACKKFMYDEKNRRNTQLRREKNKKVKIYSLRSSSTINNDYCKSDVINNEDIKNEIIENQMIESNIINNILNDDIVNKVLNIQTNQIQNTEPLKQWKAKQIYEAISTNNENEYKEYCEQNNDISLIKTWNEDWITFINYLKDKSFEESQQKIKEFVENLRRIRHNKLCYDKNSKILDREDRQKWQNTSIARAFIEGKINLFKEYMEEHCEENPENKKWIQKWNSFVDTLEKNKNDMEALKRESSKFMNSQRIKKYRKNKNESVSDETNNT